MGRRRVVEPDYEGKPTFTERLNAPVQGTAADILKLAMARLWEAREEHPNAFVVLTVHDEVVVECDAQGPLRLPGGSATPCVKLSLTCWATRSSPGKTPWRRL